MKTLERFEDKEQAGFELGLARKGYLDNYRILDAYTILNTKSGQRIFPNEIHHIRRSSIIHGSETLFIYQFVVKSGDRGYFFQTQGSRDYVMAESYFKNVRTRR